MTDFTKKISKEDKSVNFIKEVDKEVGGGMLEARYVRRAPEYFIAYLSSQTACKQACRFCWLTRTGQVVGRDATIDELTQQLDVVMDHYHETLAINNPKANTVHISFMARGEALDSKVIKAQGDYWLSHTMREMADREELFPKVMVSTIMPASLDKKLHEIFPISQPNIYYSIYSAYDCFRKKWLPKAMPVDAALTQLKEYQDRTNKIIRLHWALIKDENDSSCDFIKITQKINEFKLRVDINLVKYNPFGEEFGKEAHEDAYRNAEYVLGKELPEHTKIKVVERVGRDVYASCGMFPEKD